MIRKLAYISLGLMTLVAIGAQTTEANAQQVINGQMFHGDPGSGPLGMRYPSPKFNVLSALQDRTHPAPFYAHLRGGIDATRTHQWNLQTAPQHSWHGGYYHPQYGKPLSLVVPPTAAFQSVYGWGVGGTRSVPIYHQYSREFPGIAGEGAESASGMHARPYWPTNTHQFGVYYTRAPW